MCLGIRMGLKRCALSKILHPFLGSILEVLKDPGFEHNQPSWMRTSLRRSQRVAHSTGVLAVMAAGSATPTTTPSPLGQDEVDQPMDGWIEMEEEVITEFQDEDSREKKQVSTYIISFVCDDPLPYMLCVHLKPGLQSNARCTCYYSWLRWNNY